MDCRTKNLLHAVVFPGLLLAAVTAAWAGAPAQPASPELQDQSPVARALAGKIDLDFEKTSLDNVLLYLNEVVLGLGLSIDPGVAASGIDLSSRTVDLTVRQMPVRRVLRLVLGRNLGLKVTSSGVVVMTRDKLVRDVSTVKYPVGDLLGRLSARAKAFAKDAGEEAGADHTNYSSLNLLRLVSVYVGRANDPFVAPVKPVWTEGADYTYDTISVTQTPRGHELVVQALDLLRRAAAAPDGGAIAIPEPEDVAKTRGRLDEPVDLDFKMSSLDNVLRYISEVQRGLNIVFDPELEASGIDLAVRVIELKVKRVSIKTVLDLILGADLGYRVEPGYVLITTRERLLSENQPAVAYPVMDIVQAIRKPGRLTRAEPGARDECEKPYESLWEAYARVVHTGADPRIAPWADEGGQAMCELSAGLMIVRQTPEGQERTAGFLKLLRQAFALRDAGLAKPAAPPPVLAAGDPVPPAEAETLKLLGQEINVACDRTTLDRFLEFVTEAAKGLNIVVDPDVPASGIDISTRLVVLKGRMTVEAALLKVLGDDLAYRPMTGYVLITTRDRAQHDLPVVLYPVADIIDSAMRKHAPAVFRESQGQAGNDARAKLLEEATNELIVLLENTVNNEADPRVATWSPDGVSRGIWHLSGVLIIMQTHRGHERVAEFLTRLRREQQAAQN